MKFYYGSERFLLEQRIKAFKKEFKSSVLVYDSNEEIDRIVLDLATVSLFEENKAFIFKDHISMLDEKINSSKFIDAIGKTSYEILFILTDSKINKKNKLLEFLLKTCDSKKVESITQKDMIPSIIKIVKKLGGEIENEALLKLSYKLPVNLMIIASEISKLINQNNKITASMVHDSIENYSKVKEFALSNALVKKDSNEILSAYKNLKDEFVEPGLIIGQISSIISTAIMIGNYRKLGFNDAHIVNETKIHPYRLKKTSSILQKTSLKELEQLIKSLNDIDIKIKTGLLDANLSIEYFLIKYLE